MCVCVGVCGCAVCGCVVCVVWVAHISIVKTKKLRFFRIFFLGLNAGRSPRGEKYFFSLKKSFPEKMTFYFAPGLRPTGAKPCINK